MFRFRLHVTLIAKPIAGMVRFLCRLFILQAFRPL